jgi:hypothetical protein
MIDKHTIALISIIGCSLDLMGAMYLSYDLLGGEHGPLRTLTRAVTYGGLFCVGYGLGLWPIFGLTAGVTTGITLGWEFSRAAKQRPKPVMWGQSRRRRDQGKSGLTFNVSQLTSPRDCARVDDPMAFGSPSRGVCLRTLIAIAPFR